MVEDAAGENDVNDAAVEGVALFKELIVAVFFHELKFPPIAILIAEMELIGAMAHAGLCDFVDAVGFTEFMRAPMGIIDRFLAFKVQSPVVP